jgi:class 3 adenylate cyclase
MSDDRDVKKRFRMDFIREPILVPTVSEDEEGDLKIEAMELQFRFRPHPDRYERTEDPPGWIDTYDNTIIPDHELEPAMGEAGTEGVSDMPDDIPHYYDPPEIDDTAEYVQARKEDMELVLSGDGPIQMVEPDDDLSEQQESGVTDFIIMSIDLVRSTALMTSMERDRYLKMNQTYLNEVTKMLHHFHASVLNIQGDGIIAYLPGPNVNGMHDNAIDCAVSIAYLFEHGINEVLVDYGYPELKYRIGLDTGSPEIVPQGQDGYDLMGIAVNLATKIQESAETNEILLGEVTERNLHTRWRSDTEQVTDERDWQHRIGGEIYDIYRYNML